MKRIAPLLPILLAGLVMWWVWPAEKSGPTYKGKTAAQWETEVGKWVWDEDTRKLVEPRPKWKKWLGGIGWQLPDEPADMSLYEGTDSAAVPVLIELLRSDYHYMRLAALRGLRNRADHAQSAVPVLLSLLDDEETYEGLYRTLLEVDPDAAKKAGLYWDENGKAARLHEER